VGLRRHGATEESIKLINSAYRLLYRKGLNTSQALEQIEALSPTPELQELLAFVRGSQRGIVSAGKATAA
jgi:UDP-N-acetylglucosamine acyltransferase